MVLAGVNRARTRAGSRQWARRIRRPGLLQA